MENSTFSERLDNVFLSLLSSLGTLGFRHLRITGNDEFQTVELSVGGEKIIRQLSSPGLFTKALLWAHSECFLGGSNGHLNGRVKHPERFGYSSIRAATNPDINGVQLIFSAS